MIYTKTGVQRFLVFKPEEAICSDVDAHTYDAEGIQNGDYDELEVLTLHHALQKEHTRLYALLRSGMASISAYANKHNNDLHDFDTHGSIVWQFMIDDSLLQDEMMNVMRQLFDLRSSNSSMLLDFPSIEEEWSIHASLRNKQVDK